MTTESFFLLENAWRDQVIRDCKIQAEQTTKDEKRLTDFTDGIKTGWNQCIATMKMHGMLKEREY